MHPLKNKTVVAMCANYIYCGVLESVTPDSMVLLEPSIVYETGAWDRSDWADAQRLPTPAVHIERSAVESMFELVRPALEGRR